MHQFWITFNSPILAVIFMFTLELLKSRVLSLSFEYLLLQLIEAQKCFPLFEESTPFSSITNCLVSLVATKSQLDRCFHLFEH